MEANINIEGHSIPTPKARKLYFSTQVDQSTIKELTDKVCGMKLSL